MTSDRRPNELTALDALEQIKSGASTFEALVESCLARIQEREDIVGAWAFLSPDQALDAARATDAAVSPGSLAGLPVAVKDIMDTVDLPTAYGSPVYDGHRPRSGTRPAGPTRGPAAASCSARQWPPSSPISNPEKRPTRTHRRNAFPPESYRIMHRTKIKGGKPI